jgi:hypothetical protein
MTFVAGGTLADESGVVHWSIGFGKGDVFYLLWREHMVVITLNSDG